ncbi:MAG: sulfide dehydrogenase [Candidatus Acidiferrales bacterium]
MRNCALSVIAAAVILILAGGPVYAQTQTGNYTDKNQGSVMQTVSRKQANGATYSVDAYPLYRPELAAGEGRELVESYCNTCHSPRYIIMQPPLPAATWEAEVNKMIKTFGMTNPEGVAPKIIKYLQEHYTPETRKK